MKVAKEPGLVAFSTLFGALLFAVCIVISCEHAGHHRRLAAAPTKACVGGTPFVDEIDDAGPSGCVSTDRK